MRRGAVIFDDTLFAVRQSRRWKWKTPDLRWKAEGSMSCFVAAAAVREELAGVWGLAWRVGRQTLTADI